MAGRGVQSCSNLNTPAFHRSTAILPRGKGEHPTKEGTAMSTKTSHRRHRDRYTRTVRRAVGTLTAEDQSVICEKCGLPVLYQECFESCWGSIK